MRAILDAMRAIPEMSCVHRDLDGRDSTGQERAPAHTLPSLPHLHVPALIR